MIDLQRFYRGLRESLGRSIESTIPVRLGNREGTVFVPTTSTDAPRQVYFREIEGMQSFEGQAYIEGASGLDPSRIADGMRVRIRRHEDFDAWVVVRFDPVLNSDFMLGVGTFDEPDPIDLRLFVPFLIVETSPTPSMAATVFGAPLIYNGRFKWLRPGSVPDQTNNIPSTSGKALYILVEIDWDTGAMNVKVSSTEIDATLSHFDAADSDAGAGSIFPVVSDGAVLAGYIKLINGMSAITSATHIFNTQQVYTPEFNRRVTFWIGV